MGAQLQVPRSHMIRSRQEWNGGFSVHVSLIREENISQKTPGQLPLRSHWQDWVTFLYLGFMGSLREWIPSTLRLWGGRRALPVKKKDGEWLLGRQPRVSATLPRLGVNVTTYGYSLRDGGAFCSYAESPQTRLLFDFLSLLLFRILSPCFMPDC